MSTPESPPKAAIAAATIAISRARAASWTTTSRAASRSIRWATFTDPVFHSTRARSRMTSASSSGSSAAARAASTSARARAGRPASQALRAALNRRCALAPSGLSSAARSQAAAAASCPPRCSARPAAASRSATTAASGRSTDAARCQARRSASSGPCRASARAACTSRRSTLVAAAYRADRTSGCLISTVLPLICTSPERSASARAPGTGTHGGRCDLHGGELHRVVRGCHEQQLLRTERQATGAVEEDPLDRRRHRKVPGQARPTGQLVRREHLRHLHEGERVPPGADQQLGGHLRAHVRVRSFPEQARARRQVQSREAQDGQVPEVEGPHVHLPGREHHRNALDLDASRDEEQRRRRRVVEPMGVVHDHQHRLGVSGLGEQAQRREKDQEPVAVALAGLHAERHPQRLRLSLREVTREGHQRPEQPLQSGKGKRRLRLDPLGLQHPHVLRGPVQDLGQ